MSSLTQFTVTGKVKTFDTKGQIVSECPFFNTEKI